MTHPKLPQPTRRALLIRAASGVAAVATATIVSPASVLELEGLMSRARATGLPPLTVATLNALLRTASTQRDHALFNEARSDLRAFVRSHFTLTAKQANDLVSLTPRDVGALNAAIDAAIRENRVMDATCGQMDVTRNEPISRSEHFGVSGSPEPAVSRLGQSRYRMTGDQESRRAGNDLSRGEPARRCR